MYTLSGVLQVMVHTEFSDNVDEYPYNVDDGADINSILQVYRTPY